jgi:hypothetical protein
VPVLTRSIHRDGGSNMYEEHIYVVKASSGREAAAKAKTCALNEQSEYQVKAESTLKWKLWMSAEPRPIPGDLVSGAEIYSRPMREGDAGKWWELWHCWSADDPENIKGLD